MALAPGVRVGRYEVVAQIGVGGMGEVYRATDSDLQRSVAIKVLPDEFAGDAERLARFEREARTLAALNHPGIAIIHGFEKTDSSRALVMEFVDGPTLADRIAEGPLPIDEALAIARQIADALQAAHDQGIIHRDLKPANIKLTHDGVVKVLDFGLAKSVEPAAAVSGRSMSPTITSPAMTQAGMVLGTAAYMSPEQAKGRVADKRSDVWALGCVFYELLTGKRAFDGEDISETLASILRSEPDWKALPSETPAVVVSLLRRLLEKDRRRRIADVAAVSFVLSDAQLLSPAVASPRRSATIWIAVAVIAAIAMSGVGWSLGIRSRNAGELQIVSRLTIPLDGEQQALGLTHNSLTLSPDGRQLAYAAGSRIYLRPLNRLESISISGAEVDPRTTGASRRPRFSPDSMWLAFYKNNQIQKVSVGGGLPVPIVTAPTDTIFAWAPDGAITFLEGQRLLRVPPDGGTPTLIAEGLTGRIQSLQMLPGGKTVLLARFPQDALDAASAEVVVRSLVTGREDVVVKGGAEAMYVPTGHLLYYSNGSLLTIKFDLDTLKTSGTPTPVADKVLSFSSPGLPVSAVHVAISAHGTLAYVAGQRAIPARSLVWVDRSGREESVGLRDDSYVLPRLSPDEHFVGVAIRTPNGGDLSILDLLRKTSRPLATDAADERSITWMPDGKRVAYGSARDGQAGTWWQAADGSGTATRLAGFPRSRFGNFLPTSVSPAGDTLLVSASYPATLSDLWTLRTADGEAQPLLQTSAMERNGEISPDGRWLAYEAAEKGPSNVFVRPFPNINGGVWPVTTGGGSQPAWSRDGKELFFLDAAEVLNSVHVDRGPAFSIDMPRKVLPRAYVSTVATYGGRQYDVSRDGRRFLMMKPVAVTNNPEGPSLIIVQNFFDELRRH